MKQSNAERKTRHHFAPRAHLIAEIQKREEILFLHAKQHDTKKEYNSQPKA
jgi:hypothetical protein